MLAGLVLLSELLYFLLHHNDFGRLGPLLLAGLRGASAFLAGAEAVPDPGVSKAEDVGQALEMAALSSFVLTIA